jgi:hypothetical protein
VATQIDPVKIDILKWDTTLIDATQLNVAYLAVMKGLGMGNILGYIGGAIALISTVAFVWIMKTLKSDAIDKEKQNIQINVHGNTQAQLDAAVTIKP